MWLIIFAVSILAGIAAAIYMANKIDNTRLFAAVNSRALRKIFSIAVVIAVAAALCFVFDITNTVVIFIHFALGHIKSFAKDDALTKWQNAIG